MIATRCASCISLRTSVPSLLGARNVFSGARSFHKSSVLLGKDHDHGKGCNHGNMDGLTEKIEEYLEEFAPELQGSHPDMEDILKNNKEWVKTQNEKDPEFFKRLGGKQTPRYLYIGCSDARVDPLQLMGLKQGSLFVHRNVGNLVSSTDLNVLTVIDFAVEQLKVPHIVVCGHYDCGAVRGSIAQPSHGGLGIVENWLRNIRDVARTHRDELFSIEDKEDRARRLVELNVVEQCLNIFKIGSVQRRRVKTYVKGEYTYSLPRVHGLVFDPANGILKKLPLDFKKEVEVYRELYDLYTIPDWISDKGADNTFSEKEEGAEFWDGKKSL
mmetsp:Transcript_18571/g.40168  ORF Transcript_18571/g.40168 Transcript_18571/m.40168 type:complete len:328 (+) Transcript_18571:46-1029(+)